MNEAQRLELQQVRVEQRALRARLARLEDQLTRLEAAVEAAPEPEAVPAVPPPLPMIPPPPPLPVRPALATVAAAVPAPAPVPLVRPAVEAPPPPPLPAESLEMRIGATWFVRVGVVLLLTSLAFLGSYLYTHIVPHLGPAAKVGLLYLGAGSVAGAGAWLERSRQARESNRLRTYARVVFAGGLAGIYYVTYAAHYYPGLRVIESPLLAGALLLAWAACMVGLADRRGSETLATVAILLAYYTSAINEGVAAFTLVSNLVLTGGAVFLLRRHLWKVFPFASLLATYGSYAFWNYFHSLLGWRGLDAPPVHGGTQFWVESAFLFIYWALFTWAAFTASEETLPPARRASYVSLNNGAFFLLTTWLVLGDNPHNFWKWSLGFGVALIALAETARRLPRRPDAGTESACLLQGVLLVTLGLVTRFSGWELGLMLAAQSVALLAAAGQRRHGWLLLAAYGAALLSFSYAVDRLGNGPAAGAWASGLAEGALLLLAAWWSERLLEKGLPEASAVTEKIYRDSLKIAPAFFPALGLIVWLSLIDRKVAAEAWQAPVLALTAVGLTAAGAALRMRAVPAYAQGFLLTAYARWLMTYGGLAWPAPFAPPVWNPLILLAATLALGFWWQRKPAGPWAVGLRRWLEGADAVLLVALLWAWLQPRVGQETWTAVGTGLALAALAAGLATGYRALAVAGQGLLLLAAAAFLINWDPSRHGYHPAMWLTLCPWLGLLLTVAAVRRFLPPEERTRVQADGAAGTVYEGAATGLFLLWTGEYFHRDVLFPLYCITGGGIFALGVWRREARWLLLSILPSAAGLGVFWLLYGSRDWRNPLEVIGVACLAAQQWWGRRQLREGAATFPRPAQVCLMVAATLCAWALVTAWMDPWRGSAFSLAAAWSIFAAVVFAAGLAWRERPYRWLGLVVLAATLVRVACIDIWHLNTLERTVSGFCLSATFLGLGYLYNRYHDKWNDLL